MRGPTRHFLRFLRNINFHYLRRSLHIPPLSGIKLIREVRERIIWKKSFDSVRRSWSRFMLPEELFSSPRESRFDIERALRVDIDFFASISVWWSKASWLEGNSADMRKKTTWTNVVGILLTKCWRWTITSEAFGRAQHQKIISNNFWSLVGRKFIALEIFWRTYSRRHKSLLSDGATCARTHHNFCFLEKSIWGERSLSRERRSQKAKRWLLA